eukprot:scaffold320197_cov21-Tisochrysis_lutea.AAC.1
MRSHKDLAKDAVPHFAKAKKFYNSVAAELVAHGHTLDMFTCALDQVGLAEMKGMVLSTGGMALQTDTFSNLVFRNSLKRLFQKETEEGFIGCSSNGVLEVPVQWRIWGERAYCLRHLIASFGMEKWRIDIKVAHTHTYTHMDTKQQLLPPPTFLRNAKVLVGLKGKKQMKEVIPSKDIKVAGLLGPAARLEKKSINIADTE